MREPEEMMITTPDWLAQRGGDLKLGSDVRTWYVLFGGQPQYSVTAVPVGGKFGAAIRQTINGQRINTTGVHASQEEALRAALDDLRRALGWA
jgi:hypothetical protein